MAWTCHARRLVQLYAGLWIYGIGGALQLRAGLGLDPWNVFHEGLAEHVGLAIGTVMILVGVVVLLTWIPLRERPGVALNVCLGIVPTFHVMAVRIVALVVGVALGGLATGMYIGARYGPGPRDGLMTSLSRITGRSIRLVRTGIEVTVLVAGWLLGGTVGIGTVLFALSIGPLTQLFLPIFDVHRERSPAPAVPRLDLATET
jgi:uncharacterized membrane protein YczE